MYIKMDIIELIDITGTYTARKYIINLLSQRNRAEKLTKDWLFYLFLKLGTNKFYIFYSYMLEQT